MALHLKVILLAFVIAAPAFAETPEPRTIDMTAILMLDTGQPVKDVTTQTPDDKACDKCAPLTVGHAISMALNGSFEDERNLGWEKHFDRSSLAKQIRDSKAATLDSGEVTVIKTLVGKTFSGPIIMQIISAIDPSTKPGKVKP